jgi:DNA-directed RNA polymerase specialized sigma24 family protein
MNDRNLARPDWDRFLAWLNPNPDLAALVYEEIRHALILYFEKRQCADTAGLADQTINRVIHRLPAIAEGFSGPPLRYCYGVAGYIFKEYLRAKEKVADVEVSAVAVLPWRQDADDEAQVQELTERYLRNCLNRLDAPKRELFLRYYLAETPDRSDFRQNLALQFGLTINALRLQMLRLRDDLHRCITACQRQEASH